MSKRTPGKQTCKDCRSAEQVKQRRRDGKRVWLCADCAPSTEQRAEQTADRAARRAGLQSAEQRRALERLALQYVTEQDAAALRRASARSFDAAGKWDAALDALLLQYGKALRFGPMGPEQRATALQTACAALVRNRSTEQGRTANRTANGTMAERLMDATEQSAAARAQSSTAPGTESSELDAELLAMMATEQRAALVGFAATGAQSAALQDAATEYAALMADRAVCYG